MVEVLISYNALGSMKMMFGMLGLFFGSIGIGYALSTIMHWDRFDLEREKRQQNTHNILTALMLACVLAFFLLPAKVKEYRVVANINKMTSVKDLTPEQIQMIKEKLKTSKIFP